MLNKVSVSIHKSKNVTVLGWSSLRLLAIRVRENASKVTYTLSIRQCSGKFYFSLFLSHKEVF